MTTREPATGLNKPVMPRNQVIALLDAHRVSTELWGTGTNRTIGDLFNYHERDQLYFRNDDSSRLVIDVNAVVVIVLYRSRKKWLELYEDCQKFPDGKILRRANFNGIAETMRRNEQNPTESAHRCLREELGFKDPTLYKLSDCLEVEHHQPIPSEKWPGIWASYHRHIFECVISAPLFHRSGYVEQEKNRTIHFKWKPRGQMILAI